MQNTLSYKIEVFEGPLDLMLSLIAKNKLNIYDIPILLLVEQYMEQIRLMQENDLDVASEFLEMAARLIYLKSLSLLPKSEEEEELKKELTGKLLEYKLCKTIAKELALKVNMDKLVRGTEDVPVDNTYSRNHDVNELIAFYLSATNRGKLMLPPPIERFAPITSTRVISVSSQIVFVLRKLLKNPKISYEDLFKDKIETSERVAAFLAVLELVKSNRVIVDEVDERIVLSLKNGGENLE